MSGGEQPEESRSAAFRRDAAAPAADPTGGLRERFRDHLGVAPERNIR